MLQTRASEVEERQPEEEVLGVEIRNDR